jgi:hypothetical protein
MSDCERINDLFLEFSDNKLDGETRLRFGRHLDQCPSCRDEWKWYGLTVTALSNMDPATPPRDFIIQLNARIDAAPTSYFSFLKNIFNATPSLPLPAGVGALAFIVVIGFVLYNQGTRDIMPSQVQQVAGIHAEAKAPMGAPSTMHLQPMQVAGLPTLAATRPPSTSSAPQPYYSVSVPRSLEGGQGIAASHTVGTIADKLGADNLTVESPRIDMALESLKKMLPHLQGRLVEQRMRGNDGGVVVGVLIPPQAYGPLATELINHGAVEVGAGSEVDPATPQKKEDNNLLVYIRFVRSQ